MSARRTIVITGASDGIGAAAARKLAEPDVDLVIVGRSPEKTARVAAEVDAIAFTADFAHFDEVRQLADKIRSQTSSIDVLVNNAGGTFSPAKRTPEGHEPNYQINHLSPFLLTNLLHERLAADGGALVINTSSVMNNLGHIDLDDADFQRRRGFELRAYGSSKLMNILFARGIASRWSADKIVAAAVHPGVVSTSVGRNTFSAGLVYNTPWRHTMISPEKGAAPLIELAERGADPDINGVYFHRHRARGRENRQAGDPTLIEGLWAVSAAAVGIPD